MMTSNPSGTVTFLFTDIENSTRLAREHPETRAQRGLQNEVWGELVIRVRMGIHTGKAEAHDGEYHGYLTLSLVQRLMSAGHGGQILLRESSHFKRNEIQVGDCFFCGRTRLRRSMYRASRAGYAYSC